MNVTSQDGSPSPIRPKLVKDPLVDCLAMIYAGEVSCDLPRNHTGLHYDAEYGIEFSLDRGIVNRIP